jgi:hypothetical protein
VVLSMADVDIAPNFGLELKVGMHLEHNIQGCHEMG